MLLADSAEQGFEKQRFDCNNQEPTQGHSALLGSCNGFDHLNTYDPERFVKLFLEKWST